MTQASDLLERLESLDVELRDIAANDDTKAARLDAVEVHHKLHNVKRDIEALAADGDKSDTLTQVRKQFIEVAKKLLTVFGADPDSDVRT